ncbi:ATP-dependent RNA helicase SUPV3L1, mitochondrial-like [Amphiura filiformis]|uniref:ATP-dependent RNA helicase SUPV3L1, mitochondrial-like n=1 Tax=Amphiura filiformis TaxID=82378 RepID=UPI003B2208FD
MSRLYLLTRHLCPTVSESKLILVGHAVGLCRNRCIATCINRSFPVRMFQCSVRFLCELADKHQHPDFNHKAAVSHITLRNYSSKSFNLTFTRNYPRRRQTSNHDIYEQKPKEEENVSALFVPVDVPIKTSEDPGESNIGEELGGSLKTKKKVQAKLIKILEAFGRRPTIRMLAEERGLDSNLFHQSLRSFQNYIVKSELLEAELHFILSDLLVGSGHVDDIYPYFIKHALKVYPALNCMDDLMKISDLTDPAQWYPEARAIKRKIVFHAGPTNSGKTFHALERFCKAKSGVYCGPLKLLASEVHGKTNDRGIFCDMVTGEERRYAKPDGSPSDHIACTVEMTNVTIPYEVAVIDEIQMLRDTSRGWAWTRAFLGLCAEEVHLCGEAAAIDIVEELVLSTGDELEVKNYERLTPLKILNKALGSLDNVQPGDCIVAFKKNDLYQISRELEAMGKECAVIYGSLPPGTKLNQAQRFNDPDHPCKILVATDAVGMGLNLCIKRMIFYSITKSTINEDGERRTELLSTSQALQIAGRAGRYGTKFSDGEATTFKPADLLILKNVLAENVEPIQMAGLHPTAEQIELFAYHLPHATLPNLIDIFIKLSQLESNYFVCNMMDFKALAEMLDHIPLSLRARYVFCCAPIDRRQPFVCTMFLKFARQFSCHEPITYDWFCSQIKWPPHIPKTIENLVHLEAVHDVMDIYLWLSYRFIDMFPDGDHVRNIQKELDTSIIQEGVANITKLVQVTQEGEKSTNVGRRKVGKDLVGTSKASEKLIEMGVLSKKQLNALRYEFSSSVKQSGKKGRRK